MENKFKYSLFGCFDDIDICLYVLFCPLCQNAENLAKIRSEDCGPFHILCYFNPFWIHQYIKEYKKKKFDYFDDFLSFTFCWNCSICRDSRILKNYINE